MNALADKVSDLLKKQKRVAGMVHNQSMPRQAIVETLVQRQHLAELKTLLAQLPVTDIAALLDALPIEDGQQLWPLLEQGRQNDVLWEVSDELRELLAGGREPVFNESQMNAFVLVDGRLQQTPIEGRKNLEGAHPIWIDLLGASKAERAYVGSHFGLTLPDPDELTDLETSARYQIEDNGDIHLHSNFLLDREGLSRSVPVAFILHKGVFGGHGRDVGIFHDDPGHSLAHCLWCVFAGRGPDRRDDFRGAQALGNPSAQTEEIALSGGSPGCIRRQRAPWAFVSCSL